MVVGLMLLILASRENLRDESGPPAWSPLPPIIGCLTLTLILWVGLRDSELAYLGSKTSTAMDQIATSIRLKLQSQSSDLERLARRWSDGANHAVISDADAAAQLGESTAALGASFISYLNRDATTSWLYPKIKNEGLLGIHHRDDPVRAEALARALKSKGPVLSGTTRIDYGGSFYNNGGFVLYTPLVRSAEADGFLAAEFLYRKFFQQIIAERDSIASDYHVTISIGPIPVYDSAVTGDPAGELAPLDRIFDYPDLRLRISTTPTAAALKRDRRYFPEIALVTGLCFTGLLGLSVHLARRARGGQNSAETSNRKLLAEISERSRIEARLKISDERLRLALDSTQIGIFEWQVPNGQVYYSPGLWSLLGYEHQPHARHRRNVAGPHPSRRPALYRRLS